MRIGLDFDNTIVSYDDLFHKVAFEQGVIPADLSPSKVAVRNYLRRVEQEPVWTEMQGNVYGSRMDEASAYPGVVECLRAARDAGYELAIISHKTRYPFMGPRYDLHVAARSWINKYLCDENGLFVPESQIFFELTKEQKLSRISSFDCDFFLDDLPEILCSPLFPSFTKQILFDHENSYTQEDVPGVKLINSWNELMQLLQL